MKIDFSPVSDFDELKFDVVICAIGYEERSTHVLQKVSESQPVTLGYRFPGTSSGSFHRNLEVFNSLGGHFFENPNQIKDLLLDAFGCCPEDLQIALDISSMSRTIMAKVMACLLDDIWFSRCSIVITYAVAQFSEPTDDHLDFLDFAPLNDFSGWTTAPEHPAVMIMGLGYETDHAIGAVEFLDPSVTFCFLPLGVDKRFHQRVENANFPLLEMLQEDRIISYSVMDPGATYWQLRSLILPLLDVARVVLVPMGPKIFVSLCLFIQRQLGNEVSVWRASSHTSLSIKDVRAEGPITSYRIKRY